MQNDNKLAIFPAVNIFTTFIFQDYAIKPDKEYCPGGKSMKTRKIPLIIFIFLVGIIYGSMHVAAQSAQKDMTNSGPAQKPNIEEQKKGAYEILKEILALSDSPEREKNIPEMKMLYRKIIDTYPHLALAQESYMRSIILAKEEKTSEGDAEAESLYREFLKKYPGSRLQPIIENELHKK